MLELNEGIGSAAEDGGIDCDGEVVLHAHVVRGDDAIGEGRCAWCAAVGEELAAAG